MTVSRFYITKRAIAHGHILYVASPGSDFDSKAHLEKNHLGALATAP